MFGNLGMWEMLIILFIVLLLFGARRLPEIGGSLGKGIREFKGSLKEVENGVKEISKDVKEIGGSDTTREASEGQREEEKHKEGEPQA